jgi:hypothetical protein
MKKQKFTYETLGETIEFALFNGFMPELEEWSSPDIVSLEAEAIEYLEKKGFKVDLSNRKAKVQLMAQSKVAESWANGVPAKSWTGKLWTDGLCLYSYSLCIGTTDRNGKKIVFSYLSATDTWISPSTSKHVGFAKKVTPFVRIPTEVPDLNSKTIRTTAAAAK